MLCFKSLAAQVQLLRRLIDRMHTLVYRLLCRPRPATHYLRIHSLLNDASATADDGSSLTDRPHADPATENGETPASESNATGLSEISPVPTAPMAILRFSNTIPGQAVEYLDGSPGVLYYANHKGMGGCDGKLLLSQTWLNFVCLNNDRKSF